MDSALRQNLSDTLSSGLDKYIFAKMAAPITRAAAKEALETAESKADAEDVRATIADLEARLTALEQT